MSDVPDQAGNIIAKSNIAFGTSGARGLVEQFTDNVCAAFTIAFLATMRHRFQFRQVAIGIDRRPNSPQMAAACAGAAKALGFRVEYYGVLPTPALALQAMEDEIPAIMITGSHIPFDRNGIKFYRPDGEISKADEQVMTASTTELPKYEAELPMLSQRANNNYINRYTNLYPKDTLKGLRVGVYEHSAAGRDINIEILTQLGATVVSLGRTENFVPIDTEAVSEEDKAHGQEWAQHYELDAIFSTDGDGDRPLLADENGHWLRGDMLGLLCAQMLNIEALAVPVSCNSAIELCGSFKNVIRTKIGSPYVIEAMEKLTGQYGTVAGFEANGGFLLGTEVNSGAARLEALPTRDAILPALLVLTETNRKGQSISERLKTLPERYTASDRLKNIATKKSQELIRLWQNSPERMQQDLALPGEIKTIDTTDGLRATLTNDQIVHLRPSGNAPELRCYCEAETPQSVDTLLRYCMQELSSNYK